MKVNAFREIFRFTPNLKTQSEGEGHGFSGDGHSRDQSKNQGAQENSRPPDQAELSEAEQLQAVRAALEDFAKDSATQVQGLSAALSTAQPGLSVVLSDVNGNVIRSFSGSEFVRLRKGGQQDTRGRGKLLDQKY